MKYINALRINEATHLLETGKTIEEIAVEVGFNDPKYFSKVFKKSTILLLYRCLKIVRRKGLKEYEKRYIKNI